MKRGILLPVSDDALEACQAILQGEQLDRNVAAAASECVEAHRKGTGVDRAVAEVLARYASRQGQQDRWGR